MRNSWPAESPVRLLMHAGSNDHWNALIALSPDQDGGVLIVANTAGPEVEALQTAILMMLMSDVVQSPPAPR